jgi:xylulokinase
MTSAPITRPHVLAIDLGTSSVKVALVAEDGGIAATAVEPAATLPGAGGAAEQDAEQIWSAVLAAATCVLRARGAAARDVAAITCDAQYFSVVPVGIDGRPLANLLLWHDTRGARYSRALHRAHPDALRRWLEINGLFPLPSGSDSLSHLLFVREERPDVYERTAAFLEPADYVVARLTGRCTANPCTAFAQLLTDNRDLSAVRYDEELLAMAGVDRGVLPELVECGAPVGPLLPEVATALGLSPETPVLSGMNDTQAVSIGTGVFRSGHGGINVGTTCQVLAFTDALRADLDNNLFTMPAPFPDRYTLMAENGLGARLVDHFLHNIAFACDNLADHRTTDPYAGLEAALAAAPAGSGGVLYLPWLNGSQTPRASAAMRGGFLNMSLATTREHLLRAVIEGITYSLAWQVPAAERLCGTAFSELRFAGGGARSAQWAQTIADVANRPVLQMAEPLFLNNRATAFHAFVRLGRVGLDDVDTFCPAGARFEPRAEHRGLYDQLSGQFQAAYEQTRPIFEALNGRRASGAAKE